MKLVPHLMLTKLDSEEIELIGIEQNINTSLDTEDANCGTGGIGGCAFHVILLKLNPSGPGKLLS